MSHLGYPAAISLCLGFAHGHPYVAWDVDVEKEARNAVGLSGMAGAARER